MSLKKFWLPALLLAALSGLRAQTPPASGNHYVGSEACKTCHADVWLNFYKNPHYKSIASGKETPEKTGCEGCHGPGGDHVAARGGKATIRAFSNFTPTQTLDACLDLPFEGHAARQHPAFAAYRSRRGLHGTAIRSTNPPRRSFFSRSSRRSSVITLPRIRARAVRDAISKHRVDEGVMQCTDCHNPHGSFSFVGFGHFAPRWRFRHAAPGFRQRRALPQMPCR